MVYFFAGMSLAVIIAALMFFQNINKSPKDDDSKSLKKTGTAFMNCPVCGSPLYPGENLCSRVYRPMTVPDQRCTISGCPHCYPKCEPGVKRLCPVCHKNIPSDGYLVARLFNKTTGKKHVMVIGCTECLKNMKKNT